MKPSIGRIVHLSTSGNVATGVVSAVSLTGQLDLLTQIPVIDVARVAQIRAHARERAAWCASHALNGWDPAGDCWRAIEAACRELDPVPAGQEGGQP